MLTLRSATKSLALGALFLLLLALPAAAQMSMPNGMAFIDDSSQIRAGSNYTVALQMLVDGAVFARPDIGVFFVSSNNSLVNLPPGTAGGSFALSDDDGHVSFNITALGTGNVTITAYMFSLGNSIRASKTYYITDFGNVSGTVRDGAGQGVPGANVTLYLLNNSTKGAAAGIPLVAAGPHGEFRLENVPYGTYYVEAAVQNHRAGGVATLDRPEATVDITISDYLIATPTASPTPGPSATPSPSITPTPTASSTPAPSDGIGDSAGQGRWMLLAAVLLAAIIVAVGLTLGRKGKK